MVQNNALRVEWPSGEKKSTLRYIFISHGDYPLCVGYYVIHVKETGDMTIVLRASIGLVSIHVGIGAE